MPRPKAKRSVTVVPVSLLHTMELYRQGYAEISTGEIKLTPAGRKKLSKAGVGVRLVIEGTAQE
jgi:hypothetical protein